MYRLKILSIFIVPVLMFTYCDSNSSDPEDTPKGKGWVYGEFQDKYIYDSLLVLNPDLANWTSKETLDGTTGATLCEKWLRKTLPERKVTQNSTEMDVADGWGQFGFEIEEGTYQFTGSCDGYVSETKSITVLPDSNVYLNFFLERE